MAPSEKPAAVGLAIAVMGCASLFAWNAVITASGYYQKRLCGSALHHSFESAFGLTYQMTSIVATVFAALNTERLSPEKRIVPCQIALSILFVAFAALACAPSVPRDSVFVPATLVGVGLCGVFSQMLSSALYGVTTALPRFMSANMAGQAVGGLIPALIVVATGLAASKSSGDFDDDDDGGCAKVAVDAGAVGYFLAAAALFAVSVAAFRFLERSELYGAALGRQGKRPSATTTRSDLAEVINDGGGDSEEESGLEAPLVVAGAATDDDDSASRVGNADRAEIVGLARVVAVPGGAVYLVFAVTLSVFPALTALARVRGHADDDSATAPGGSLRALYTPLLFLTFNVGDFLGRAATPYFQHLSLRPNLLLALAVARAAFIPLFAMGTLSGASAAASGAMRSTLAPFLVMVPFALSNGLVATLAMGAAAPLVPKHRRELAGNLMALFLTLGLTSGSSLSFALLALI